MNLLQYVQRLAPVYGRREVVAALTQLQEELEDHTLPITQELRELLAQKTFQSPTLLKFEQALRKRVAFKDNCLGLLIESLETLNNNLPLIEQEIKRAFSFQFATSNLTYNRANLLRYLEAATFYVRYFRKLLLRVLAEEALLHGPATPLRWPKAERLYLEEHQANFIGLYPAMSLSDRDLKQALKEISTAEIQEETFDIAVQSLGGRKIDPIGVVKFSPTSNLFFTFGKMLAEWKVKRYQASKEEHQALQLRLQELRELMQEGHTNPKLQKLVTYTEQRIEQLDYEIKKIEDENRWDD